MKRKSEIREQLLTISIGLAAALIVFVVGAPDRWLAAIFITVGTFAGMISYFRSRWSSKLFWKIMAGALVIHLSAIWLVFGVLLRNQRDVGLMICVPPIFLEAFLIYHAVLYWERQADASHSERSAK